MAAAKSAPSDLTVFEAASLKDVFATLAARFEKDHPGTHVVANAAGSQELRAQIEQGAPADVFASADERHMNALVSQNLAVAPVRFTCNEPVLAVRTDLAGTIKTFADLPRAERIVVGAPEVPIGAYTAQIWQKARESKTYGADFAARVQAKVVSRELNVRQLLAKIALGEADAGVVYRSDTVAAKGKVAVVEIPAELNVTAAYPIAALKAASHPDLARAFIDLVRSPTGVAALREAGFVPCASR
jgi:molybdate transport system substrate-binding protein